jgi:hypothetical protein
MIVIAARFRPFSHKRGSACLLPGTHEVVRAYPHLIQIGDIEVPLPNDPYLHDFTLQQDLERNCVFVFGKTYRIKIVATPDGIAVGPHFFPKKMHLHLPQEIERLSLGAHKAQDWDFVLRRMDLREILPPLYMLSQKTPWTRALDAFSYAPCFSEIMVPRQDFASPLAAIRSLFFQEGERYQILKNPFPAGRLLNLQTPLASLDLEWTRFTLRRIVLRPKQSGTIFWDLPGIVSFRSQGLRHLASSPFSVDVGQPLLLDSMHADPSC